ncbi:NADP-dependent oxidoreductase domain-containing protein [Hygrophoropsis aurantiaca]|uniref:NADP-dependent oxidoreductase domain-containing protein n=1 Tax=Hygrophoropsis aurantiaca TaxID=72124 RepID=A0ACB8A379_9AGAM|nr:NADP-dependent oxidoreductase domain-containing protein [Hygrophoropsis aurantiaca]
MSSVPLIKLNNGVLMPAIGLGCWGGLTLETRAASKHWILNALKTGYRHLDTALGYGTEKSVGEAIRESGIPREEIFVTTKLPPNHAGRVHESLQESLTNAGLDYYDLYLIHWPQTLYYDPNDDEPKNPDGSLIAVESPTFNETWAAMEQVLESGKAKAIGISNFSIKNVEKLLTTAKVIPAINQVELHPYLAQPDLLEYCRSKGIYLTAYTPTGYATVRGDPLIISLAEKYKTSPGQIILGWHVARGNLAVPKSENPARQRDNISVITLTPEDVQAISGLDQGKRLCNKPDSQGKVFGWTAEQMGW